MYRSSNNIYNQSLVASLIKNNGKGKIADWSKGMVSNMARSPKGNDRAQILAVAAGEADIAVANTYYLALMLSGKKGPEQQAAAKKVKPLPLDLPTDLLGNLKRLGDLVVKQLTDVINSYINKDYDKAKEVWAKDEQVDDLTYLAMNSVVAFLSKDKKNLDFSTHLIFATKNLERVGDHITNIAESICYLIKGEYLKGHRPKGRETIT